MRPGQRATVYITDDDAAVRSSLALLLRCHGYRTAEFAGAAAFLAWCGNSGLEGCLLTDLKMAPMDGAELLEALKIRGIGLPAVAMTAHDDPALERRALHAGASRVLKKPLTDRVLIEAIEFALGRHPLDPLEFAG